ncbi:hypothetical protein [Azoarcus sp. KH32C]|uniref:hypothetical protein n=1 Tax=Azoarcus sp. KH32C TaxID=748247 RepID=UPI0002386582|nr:hypothetical protein [Azoarcus sp. KH32C]BAL22557.1 hypothetical protein AZKH_0211 [Azoarcus sp. KH32C]
MPKRHISRSAHLGSFLLACFLGSALHAEEYGSIYFYGNLKHADPRPTAHEGGMDLFGLSKELHSGPYQFDTGVKTYVDTYGKRSYAIFSNVSHENFRYGLFTPMLGLTCTYKGEDYGSDKMQTYCFPLPMLRIGQRSGLFADLSALPHVGHYTNGWAALELGFKW